MLLYRFLFSVAVRGHVTIKNFSLSLALRLLLLNGVQWQLAAQPRPVPWQSTSLESRARHLVGGRQNVSFSSGTPCWCR
jgi:hypothetical protein